MAKTDEEAKSSGSTLRMRRTLTRFFNYVVEQAWATVSPMHTSELEPKGGVQAAGGAHLPGRGAGQGPARARPEDATTNPHHERDAIALALMGVLGLRAEEIVRLDLDHFSRATLTAAAALQIYDKGRTWSTVPARRGWKP